jgi:hypothetical protein
MAPSRIAVRARRRSLVKDLGFPDPRGARSLRRRSHGTRGAVCCGALGPLMARTRPKKSRRITSAYRGKADSIQASLFSLQMTPSGH